MINSIIESGRVEFALQQVKQVIAEEEIIKNDENKELRFIPKDYRAYCRKFPSMIHINGLAASLAYALDKKKAYMRIFKQIEEWLLKNGFFSGKLDLQEYVFSLNSEDYRIVTKEVIALLVWISRFASGLIEEES